MPSILLHGFLARGRRPNLLELWWGNRMGSEAMAFFVVLKATRKREVLVTTFHRIDFKEVRRLRRKGEKEGRLIRQQAGAAELFRSKHK